MNIQQRRRTAKLIKSIEEHLTKLELDLNRIVLERINGFREKLKICNYCEVPYIEVRAGRSKFCSDICRTNAQRGKIDASTEK